MKLGARYSGGRCVFSVLAPLVQELVLKILAPSERLLPMTRDEHGLWTVTVENIAPGTKYLYRINGKTERPDPASFHQPEDIFGPSSVVDHAAFSWNQAGTKEWKGIPLEKMIIYELHVGTFTPEGTFAAAISKLNYLKGLGITAVELMPVAQFPGERNWGYDGVYPFAVQHSYGGPEWLKKFIKACHDAGMAVILDVVYNHLGPEGNFLGEFMPVFTEKYRTPWGNAVNYDGTHSDGVREYFIQNALYWFEHFRIDALRLDAIHGIYDMGAKHFLAELAERVEEFSKKERKVYLIAESDLNDRRTVLPRREGGWGMDAQWHDDFHHAVHTLLTGERHGYYQDFGKLSDLAKAIKEGFVYSWGYSRYRNRYHGSSSKDFQGSRFVACLQNHDQIGNRMKGERLSALIPFEALKLAAVTLMFSPYIPLVFMGEEYGEDSPFLYFVSFHEAALNAAVRKGRKREFSAFRWAGEPPDPADLKTFLQSKLKWDNVGKAHHAFLLAFYKELIRLRGQWPALQEFDKKTLDVRANETDRILVMERRHAQGNIFVVLNFSDSPVKSERYLPHGSWRKILDSEDKQWGGCGGSEAWMRPLSVRAFSSVTKP